MTSAISKFSPEYPFSLNLSNPSPTPSTTSSSSEESESSSESRSSTPSLKRPAALNMTLIKDGQKISYNVKTPLTQASDQSSPLSGLESPLHDAPETNSVTLDALQFKLWMEMYDRSLRVHEQARQDIMLLQSALKNSQERETGLQIALCEKNSEIETLKGCFKGREKNLKHILAKKNRIINGLQRDLNELRCAPGPVWTPVTVVNWQ